ncbi:L-aminoadipate-semialdehyde dehydrogenase large subunit [Cytospora mali]|uniref:L-aminoadipate-semialdehyde dehydrogenase large subunit n=1 Tax=Cytospora mali TaxID=578113 RepID=A0A194VL67_CYTMA|nr:L-aminoadipate-semialdehyde dehydrogenase large subunit [Valsa mali]
MYEASNLLAHHLHDAGVTNGDAVMIWAHRSVDLVVCIMGTLGIWCHNDCACPGIFSSPSTGLSTPSIDKNWPGTDENGLLAPLVQSYIDESLQLEAKVPELRLRDDGYLFGGEVSGQDVFQSAREKASSPDVLVGPDSNPTLSFASGSEGRPQGVLGRHFKRYLYATFHRRTTPPKLPFPEIIERTEETFEEDLKNWDYMTETEQVVAQKWAELIPGLNPKTIQGENSFFDLGGHMPRLRELRVAQHYIKLSGDLTRSGQGSIMEEDGMQGCRTGLGTGYGQTKWVSEQLIREASRRRLQGTMIQPGYTIGDCETGVCNVDEFLIRMLKGCIQLQFRPHIINTVNAVPVNHVARVVVAGALNPIPGGVHVAQVTAYPRLRMDEYLAILEYSGFKTPEVSYDAWKEELEKFCVCGSDREGSGAACADAAVPLLHERPPCEDKNTVAVLKRDADRFTGVDKSVGYGVSREDIGRYLRYLAGIKYIGFPSERGRQLPDIKVDIANAKTAGGRGGTS